ncbi:MAG TPA: hypothetical protein VF074_09180, partial [Pyrinomonadaceae bacterium]
SVSRRHAQSAVSAFDAPVSERRQREPHDLLTMSRATWFHRPEDDARRQSQRDLLHMSYGKTRTLPLGTLSFTRELHDVS